ncbi:MAG: AMP-binding protein, partial [Rhizobiales bacterium]|nr:AMP-binding protein [Hyphomicrobiales bacterium]
MLPGQHRTGSVGQALNGGEVKIDEPDEEGVGEILLRGPNVTAAYLNNENAHRTTFDAGGWFRTGDLGRLDEAGFLYIAGRRKEIITLGGGKKVNPGDLEKAYLACGVIEDIAILEKDGSLVALVRPNSEALRTIGVVNPIHAIDIGLTEIMQQRASHERLTGFEIARAPLPRTRLGKLRRFMLPELYEEASTDKSSTAQEDLENGPVATAEDAIGQAVIDHLKRRFPDKMVRSDSNPSLDLGLDSLGWMGLALELEERLGHSLVDAELSEATNVTDLIERERCAEATGQPLGRRLDLGDPKDWLRPRGPGLRIAAVILWFLNRLVMRVFFRLKVEGGEHLPARGPFIVAPNHVSDLDPLVIAAALPYAIARQLFWAGDKNRLFYNRAARLFCRIVHLFPVDEFKPDEAIDTAATVLSRGGIQVWFPEGWRSPDGAVLEFRPGIGILLQRTGTNVVPAYIDGAFEALPRNRKFPRRADICVSFGVPVSAETLKAQGEGTESDERIASALRIAVVDLTPNRGAGPAAVE